MNADIKRTIPWVMIVLRMLGCPLIAFGALRGLPGGWLSLIVLLALLSDIYDGILARRWNNETPALRISDSIADTIFYLGVAAALWLRDPQMLRGNWRLLAVLFGLEGFRYVFDLRKFRKTASYHSYLAKSWGLVLAIAIIGVLSFDRLRPLFVVALVLGILVNLEGLAMSLMLPRWQNDVRTLAAAWRLRQTIQAEESACADKLKPYEL